MSDILIAGAGMAGLVAAAQARRLGAEPSVWEKGERIGGAMALSSGVIWRHRRLEDFRSECPGGEPGLQRMLFEGLDEDLDWLESLGAPVLEAQTGNPLTVGRRFDVPALVAALANAAGPVTLGQAMTALPDVPVVLASGGFAANRDLVRRHITPEADSLALRSTPWSTGDGLGLGVQAGAETSGALNEFYGRAMPAPPARIAPEQFVSLAQLYARHAEVIGAHGERFEVRRWSETDVVQWIARQPQARARYRVGREALARRVRERSVAEMVAAAERAGAHVQRDRDGSATVEVVAAITTTLGGLRADTQGRVAHATYAAGNDVGGFAGGGYCSGLAAALVLGRAAARGAVEAARRGQRPLRREAIA